MYFSGLVEDWYGKKLADRRLSRPNDYSAANPCRLESFLPIFDLLSLDS